MQYVLYTTAGYLVAGTLVVIAIIGKPRRPLTPSAAVASVIVTAALVVPLIILALRIS